MGKAATRITAEDFLTPPELTDFKLAADGAGRIGGACLELASSGAKTRLADCYQQVPLRLLSLSLGPSQPALVYLLNPTAGLFDGDAQLVRVHAGAGTRTLVAGQAATRIHPCLHGFSTQQWHICVAAGAVLAVLPGPAIPFQGCRYFQKVVVDLAEGAHFIWGDIWLAGRYARGANSERFLFQTLIQDFTVRQEGRLVFRDRFCWQGPWLKEVAQWHFGQADAYGSLFSSIRGGSDMRTDSGMTRQPPAKEASFATAAGHACTRWLGRVQAVTSALVKRAMSLAGHAAGHSVPWLLESRDLAPNHWFSV